MTALFVLAGLSLVFIALLALMRTARPHLPCDTTASDLDLFDFPETETRGSPDRAAPTVGNLAPPLRFCRADRRRSFHSPGGIPSHGQNAAAIGTSSPVAAGDPFLSRSKD